MDQLNWQSVSNSYRNTFLAFLGELLKIPSVFDEKTMTTDHPFGIGINQALEYMLRLGKQEGFYVKNVDGYAGHIEFGEGDEVVGVLGHLDVVPAEKGWSNPPFDPIIKEGKLYARGAQDDKGPVMAAFVAMKLLKDLGYQPKKRIRLILGTDEERSWQGMAHYFEHEAMPVVGFSPDADFPVIHAEKGLIDGYITIHKGTKEHNSDTPVLHSFRGGDRLNMVPDEATAEISWGDRTELNYLFQGFIHDTKYDGEIDETDEFCKINIKGKSAHAGQPSNGINAVIGLTQFLSGLPFEADTIDTLTWIFAKFYDSGGVNLGISGEDLDSGKLTVNLGSLCFEKDKGRFQLGVNIRYPVTFSYDKDVVGKLQPELDDVEGILDVEEHLKPLYLEKDHYLVEKLLNVYEKQTGQKGDAVSIGGGTYARSLATGVAFGAMFENSPNTAHQADEHIVISDLLKAIGIYAESLYELTKS